MLEKLQPPLPNTFEQIILNLFKRLSVCIAIMGRRDTGKTDLSLLIMETLAKFQITKHFATNIKTYENNIHIEYITNLEDLTLWCNENKGRKLFILDEAGKSLRRRTPMSGLNIKLLDQLQILRKYKLSLILVFPHEKYIDSATMGSDVLDAVIYKPYFNNRKIALYHDLFGDEAIWFTDLPATQLGFNTWDVAPFRKDAPTRKPHFKDSELEIVWEWSHGKTAKDLGLHSMKLHRILKKFCKEVTERDSHVSQP